MINSGLIEMNRVVRKGGYVLVKCMDYISSGKLFMGTYFTVQHAHTLGMETVERFEHVGAPGMQPAGRRQVHARRNLSTLLVFKVK